MRRRLFFLLLLFITILFAYDKIITIGSKNNIVINVKVLDEKTNTPIPDAKTTLLIIKNPIFNIPQQHFIDIKYTNDLGEVSFIIDQTENYILWVKDDVNENFDSVEINKKTENHSIIVIKM